MTRNQPHPPVAHDNSDGGAAVEDITTHLEALDVRDDVSTSVSVRTIDSDTTVAAIESFYDDDSTETAVLTPQASTVRGVVAAPVTGTVWQQLCRQLRVEPAPSANQCKQRIHSAIVEHFTENYPDDTDNRLPSWQQLCRDVRVEEGTSINQCKKNLEAVFVNIADFVAAQKRGEPVPTFASVGALRRYIKTYSPAKKVNRKWAKEHYILKWMLIRLY